MAPRTLSWLWLTLLLLSAQLLPVAAAASLQGEVRLVAARAEPVWVGQEVELYLELWSDGFSFGDQLFALPEVKGGFLLQGDSSTVKLSESRAGASWQGLRYTLLLYPQAAGRLQVPAFEVRFSSRAGFGSEPTAFAYRTKPLAIEARLPPGANAGDLLVTTGNLRGPCNCKLVMRSLLRCGGAPRACREWCFPRCRCRRLPGLACIQVPRASGTR